MSNGTARYIMGGEQMLEFSLPHIKRIFGGFDRAQISGYHVCRAEYAQLLIERNYSKLICPAETPVKGLYIATMAQIYPEDRGVNYAISQGRQTAGITVKYLGYSETGESK
jgi:hypothetical protein